jgi:hypothetical protein
VVVAAVGVGVTVVVAADAAVVVGAAAAAAVDPAAVVPEAAGLVVDPAVAGLVVAARVAVDLVVAVVAAPGAQPCDRSRKRSFPRCSSLAAPVCLRRRSTSRAPREAAYCSYRVPAAVELPVAVDPVAVGPAAAPPAVELRTPAARPPRRRWISQSR